ncbi:MAG: HAMP domain-containing histidine kinase [Chloroflexi bacterium]|nr:MAG: HAMP domain-containing histidine kinase [Chloroflexota bacterium]
MMRRWGPPPRRRPPWWPEDQAWPPAGGWRRRGPPPFIWRLGCSFLIAVVLLAVSASVAVSWLATHYGLLPVGAGVALLVVLLILIAGRGMRRFTRPMDDLIAAAGRIEQGDYSARIREYGPRELRSVARAFNSMSARLQSSDEGRRSFLADVAHELRTPLAVIRAEAEAIADGVHPADTEHLGTIVDATQSLDVLVEDLRALALTDTGSLVLNREAVETSALIDDSIALFDASGKAANVRITGDVQDGMPVLDVDPVRMRAALGNVIGNAIAHTPPGGSVRVDARLDGNHVEIVVTDTGEGIPPELLPRVFDRFVKGAGSKGSGLGLAIAHDIVVAHAGSISIESTAGTGTTVRITLPIAE